MKSGKHQFFYYKKKTVLQFILGAELPEGHNPLFSVGKL